MEAFATRQRVPGQVVEEELEHYLGQEEPELDDQGSEEQVRMSHRFACRPNSVIFTARAERERVHAGRRLIISV